MARVRTYQIRRVDADEFADDIQRIEDTVELPRCTYEDVTWWLAFVGDHPIAYCGLMPSELPGSAYLVRVGVLAEHRGNGLQFRMMRIAEVFARRQGYADIISDTRCNVPSANNFVRAGYRMFDPPAPWGMSETLYWRKVLQ